MPFVALYALLPVALVEEGYLWLSSQPMTLLLLLSIYLLLRNYPILSSLILAVSILFKQEAVFILPVYVFWYAFRGRSKMKKGFTVFVFSLFLASLPFLVISPSTYLNGVTSGSLGIRYVGSNLLRATNGITTVSAETCSSTFPSIHSSIYVMCGMTYSFSKPAVSYLIFNSLDWIAAVTAIPLLVMVAIILFFSRKKNNVLELACAYSMIAMLCVFSVSFHALYVYYFIPVYAFLFSSARSRSSVMVLGILSALSLFTPDKSYAPVLLSLVSIAIISSLKDTSRACGPSNSSSASVGGPTLKLLIRTESDCRKKETVRDMIGQELQPKSETRSYFRFHLTERLKILASDSES